MEISNEVIYQILDEYKVLVITDEDGSNQELKILCDKKVICVGYARNYMRGVEDGGR